MLHSQTLSVTDLPVLDETNKKNLLLLIQLRWLAIVGQVGTIAIVHLWLGIALPVPEMAAVILLLVGLNLSSLLRYGRQGRVSRPVLFIELLFDVAALTVQFYLSGGATNPFISLYLLQVILATILLDGRSAWLIVAVTSGCFIWLTSHYQEIALPHAHGGSFFNLHVQGMFFCFALAACLLVVFISRIQRILAERDAHLAQMRQQAIEDDNVIRMGLLASGAAHELGTPLNTLAVIIEDWEDEPLLKQNPRLSAEVADMRSQLDRCRTILSGILMSFGEARGEGTVRTTLAQFFDEAVSEWSGARLPGAFSYRKDLTADADIVSDPVLKQVLFNVLDNAFEASPEWVGLTARRDREELVIEIKDQGPGFREAMLTELGRPYRTTKNRPGAGLGLFLVANVIRKLGGTLEARNMQDRGANVTLTLPLSALALESTGGC